MNWLLIIVVGVLALYMVSGYKRGLLKIVFSLVGWLAILALAVYATPYVGKYISGNAWIFEHVSGANSSLEVKGIAFVVCLIVLIIVFGVISGLLEKVNDVPLIGTVNRFAGLVVGAAKGLIIVWIAFAVVALNATVSYATVIISYIYESEFLVWIYENNYILMLIKIFSRSFFS